MPNSISDLSVRAFGARGDGLADDTHSFEAALDHMGEAFVPPGQYRVSAIGPAEFQKPVYLHGSGAGSVIELVQATRPALRVAAVGGAFGDTRAPTIIEKLVFKRSNAAIAGSLTAIDLHSVHTYKIDNVAMIGLGAAALQMKSCYYGSINSLSLANSGLMLSDVNNCSITGSDIRPDEFKDKSRGKAFFAEGLYPITLIDSTKNTFLSSVIEGWSCPVMLLRRSSNTVLNSCWLEGLRSPTHVIRCENVASLEIVNSWIDLSLPYSECFIEVDNSAAVDAIGHNRVTDIRFIGGTLTATGRAFGDAEKLVRVANRERVRVLIDAVTFRGGRLYADPSVTFDVRSLTFSGPFRHFITSLPNARVERERNSWMPDSKYPNWDFKTIDLRSSENITINRTGTAGEFLTGTGGLRISGFVPNAVATATHETRGNIDAVKREGQTYIVFARVKSSAIVELKFEINGGYKDFSDNPFFVLPVDEWRDIMFKTQEDVSWAQGRFQPPSIILYVKNISEKNACIYLDRLDYALVEGDYMI